MSDDGPRLPVIAQSSSARMRQVAPDPLVPSDAEIVSAVLRGCPLVLTDDRAGKARHALLSMAKLVERDGDKTAAAKLRAAVKAYRP